MMVLVVCRHALNPRLLVLVALVGGTCGYSILSGKPVDLGCELALLGGFGAYKV